MRSRGKIAMPRLLTAGATLLVAIGILTIGPSKAATDVITSHIPGPGAAPSELWVRTLTDNPIDPDFIGLNLTVRAVALDSTGANVYAFGTTLDPTFGSNDLVVLSLDATDGSTNWQTVFDGGFGGFEDIARGLALAPDDSALYLVFDQEVLIGSSLPVQIATMALDTADGSTLWGPVDYPSSVDPKFSIDTAYSVCLQPNGLQLIVGGQAISTVARPARAIPGDANGSYTAAVDGGSAMMYLIAVDTTDGSANWTNLDINVGTAALNAANLATGHQPGILACDCNDTWIVVAATDVGRNGVDTRDAGWGAIRTNGDFSAPFNLHNGNGMSYITGAPNGSSSVHLESIGTNGDPVMYGGGVAETAGVGVLIIQDITPSGSGFGPIFFFVTTIGPAGHYTEVDFRGPRAYQMGSRVVGGETRYYVRARTKETGAILYTKDFTASVAAGKPDKLMVGAALPAVFPLSGERFAFLGEDFVGTDRDARLVLGAGRIIPASLEDADFNDGDMTGSALYDGTAAPSDENIRPAQNLASASQAFTKADFDHDFPSHQLLAVRSYGSPNITSQLMAVGVTEVGSSHFTVILYEPAVPVPPTVTITTPSGSEPVAVNDDTTLTATVGRSGAVNVTLGDNALGFDPVQTTEEAVYLGLDGGHDALLTTGSVSGPFSGRIRLSRANVAPAAIAAACAAREGLHSLDADAVDGLGFHGNASLSVDVDNMLFTDVDCLNFAFLFINACKRSGISAGFGDGSYHPTDLVNRATMSVFTARVVSYNKVGSQADFTGFVPPVCVTPGVVPATFSDVPCAYFAYKHIYYLVSNSVASGTTASTYSPTLPLRRNAMAVFMAKAKDFADDEGTLAGFTPPACGFETFADVGCAATFYKEIEYIKAHLITSGFGDGTYRPTGLVDRAAMSVMLVRCTGDEDGSGPFNTIAF